MSEPRDIECLRDWISRAGCLITCDLRRVFAAGDKPEWLTCTCGMDNANRALTTLRNDADHLWKATATQGRTIDMLWEQLETARGMALEQSS